MHCEQVKKKKPNLSMLNHLCPAFLQSRGKKSGPRCFSTKNPPQTRQKGVVLFEYSDIIRSQSTKSPFFLDHRNQDRVNKRQPTYSRRHLFTQLDKQRCLSL
ncbi:hypothetical protein CEXT_104911 [Caerostris extrusa]|uniref:Uncharacterized protein n=1 Tax=Caerostris extrusa TaxID=172846 RepID=A0AAV4XTR8_CAEEX|nr:hypothetical protein CEXT_104911 [Caerostris extrusa]